jgi:hypothetical protein
MLIDSDKRKQIIDALRLGMPLGKVADLVELPLAVIQQELRDDPAFNARVNHATAECMHSRLEKLAGLNNWQALAFILQSLWPERFGRRQGTRKRRKPEAAQANPDFSQLSSDERDHLEYLLAKVHGRIEPDGNDQRVPSGQRVKALLLYSTGVARR